MIGKRFGRLVVVRFAWKSNSENSYWECRCDCNNTTTVYGGSLRSGETKSCGCLRKETHTTHGMYETPTYRTWADMIRRCNNPKAENYKDYGGRGIKVCGRWLKFENFFEDIGVRPVGLTLERKNNELGYSTENCCWATKTQQARNQRIFKNNKTGVRGVYWGKHRQKYRVQICVNYKIIYIGSYDTIEDATTARKQAELKYWR